MKRWVVVGVVLLMMHATSVIFSGIGCSTLCTQETTTVTTIHTTAREHGLLSSQRKYHPANKSKSQLQVEALNIVSKTTVHDIHVPGLSAAEKEERVRLVKEGAQLRIKELKEQAHGKQRRKKGRKYHCPTQMGLRAAIEPDIVPRAPQPALSPALPVEEA